ncbi:MAG: sigma 54-interacting transcriptional regulator [Gammaproteobacteria bacterium]|nr:sigma 54-interacting transcriptional regulator [Gammaproteobacteria bacterium]
MDVTSQNPAPSVAEILRVIAEGTADVTGKAFFEALVRNLAVVLRARYAWLGELLPGHERVRVLAHYADGRPGDWSEFDIAGTPCEQVLCGETKCYRSGVGELFPVDRNLFRQMGVDSYMAIPIKSPQGEVLGNLAVMNDRPILGDERDYSIFQIFAARAGVELQRQRAEEALHSSEQRLAGILTSALDAIITVDADLRVVMFNPAAERIFRCAADAAAGRPLSGLLDAGLLVAIRKFIRDGAAQCQFWLPQDAKAQRANGEIFAVDGSMASSRQDGRPLYTVILRDVEERRRAERELARLGGENEALRRALAAESAGVRALGESAPMRALEELVAAVGRADTTVLIQGETGTGKELVAQSIHARSPRAGRLLVKMNCAALPAELIESELFGHERGAFTGATAQRKGRFELANGGSLFLDEVGELTAAAQAKLLRVLQEQQFERVGGSETVQVDVRVIAATNRDLGAMVREGAFRADLYYRLAVFPVAVPPLRERGEDIVLLARHFLAGWARKLGKTLADFTPESRAQMLRYPWPGNVRELQNVVERSAILARTPDVKLVDRAIESATVVQPVMVEPPAACEPDDTASDDERDHITRALAACNWVVEGPHGAAACLGVGASTLRYRIKKLAIRRHGRA